MKELTPDADPSLSRELIQFVTKSAADHLVKPVNCNNSIIDAKEEAFKRL